MSHDPLPPTDPEQARKIYPRVFLARPATDFVVEYATQAGPTPPKEYPECELSASNAIIDSFALFAVVFAFIATPFGFTVMTWIEKTFPELGAILSNSAIGALTVSTIALILIVRKRSPSSVGLTKPRLMLIPWTLGAIPACYVTMFAIGILHTIFTQTNPAELLEERQQLFDLIPENTLATYLLFGLFTGFHEELLFRGFVLTRANAIFRNRWIAVLIAASLFGLVHYPVQGWIGVFQTGGIGLVLGIVSVFSRSLWPAIFAHAAFNSMQLAMFPFLKKLLDEQMQMLEATSQPAIVVILKTFHFDFLTPLLQ